MLFQYTLKGTDFKGKTVFSREVGPLFSSSGTLSIQLDQLVEDYPEAIHFELHISIPDPQVVRIKRQLTDIICNGVNGNESFDKISEVIFNSFNIKSLSESE